MRISSCNKCYIALSGRKNKTTLAPRRCLGLCYARLSACFALKGLNILAQWQRLGLESISKNIRPEGAA